MRAVYQRRGGYLLSETAVAAHAEMARRRGAEVLLETKVLGWESGVRGVRVRSERGTHEARRLVITAGAWTGGLARSLRQFCRPERQVMLWTEPLDRAEFEPARFPVFVLDAPLGLFYGFPNHDSEGFKFGKFHHLRQGVDDPSKLDRACRPEDERVLREGIAEYFPRANGPRRKAAACMFTNSPDGDFILDRHPSHDRVFVAAGLLRPRVQVLRRRRQGDGRTLPRTGSAVGHSPLPADAPSGWTGARRGRALTAAGGVSGRAGCPV